MAFRYSEQWIDQADVEAVLKVLNSDVIAQGPMVEQFEKLLTNYTAANHCKAFNSATSALHAGYLALGVGANDIVWTSPNTFVATANAAQMCGAKVDFVDINYSTRNIDLGSLEDKLRRAAKINALPKVVVPVHFGGLSCDMVGINALAKKYEFSVMEDASHAIGGSYNNTVIGSCHYSDIAVFSFHPVKVITTGEGGAACTNCSTLNSKLELYRSHGVTRRKKELFNKNLPKYFYEMQNFGFNYRLTDIQAALGISQMKRLDEFVKKRNILAEKYNSLLGKFDLNPVVVPEFSVSSFHLYTICINNRDVVYNYLHDRKIEANVHYIPVHIHPYWKRLGFKKGDFPVAERYYNEALSLPLHPKLKEENLEYIVEQMISVFG
tara:strand:+ start:154 stop:1296 length:1143 start_codon:yes stop_codon:yes gene_type:complete